MAVVTVARRRGTAGFIGATTLALLLAACGGDPDTTVEPSSTSTARTEAVATMEPPSTSTADTGDNSGSEAVDSGSAAEASDDALEPLVFADAADAAITVEELAARYGGSWTFEAPARLNMYEIDGTAIAIDPSECEIDQSAHAENLPGIVFEGIDTFEQWFFEGPGYEDPLEPGEMTHYDVDGGAVAHLTTAVFPSPADATAFFGEVSGLTCGTSEMQDLQGEPLNNRFVTTVEVPGFDETVVGSNYLSDVAVGRSGSAVLTVSFASGELEANPMVAPDGPAQAEVVEFLTWLRAALDDTAP